MQMPLLVVFCLMLVDTLTVTIYGKSLIYSYFCNWHSYSVYLNAKDFNLILRPMNLKCPKVSTMAITCTLLNVSKDSIDCMWKGIRDLFGGWKGGYSTGKKQFSHFWAKHSHMNKRTNESVPHYTLIHVQSTEIFATTGRRSQLHWIQALKSLTT